MRPDTGGHPAGPTFQNVVDPVQPSVDPTYANPQNEIWLDFRTDEAGSSQATVDWGFTADRRGEVRSSGARLADRDRGRTRAGSAGSEVGCVTVPGF